VEGQRERKSLSPILSIHTCKSVQVSQIIIKKTLKIFPPVLHKGMWLGKIAPFATPAWFVILFYPPF
jgi:hypothetical protein